jgi:hypothetical protein
MNQLLYYWYNTVFFLSELKIKKIPIKKNVLNEIFLKIFENFLFTFFISFNKPLKPKSFHNSIKQTFRQKIH